MFLYTLYKERLGFNREFNSILQWRGKIGPWIDIYNDLHKRSGMIGMMVGVQWSWMSSWWITSTGMTSNGAIVRGRLKITLRLCRGLLSIPTFTGRFKLNFCHILRSSRKFKFLRYVSEWRWIKQHVLSIQLNLGVNLALIHESEWFMFMYLYFTSVSLRTFTTRNFLYTDSKF